MWAERNNMNSVVLIGRLTRDPELRKAGETSVTKITVAVDRPGSKEKKADFIGVTIFGVQAENVCKYLSKGRQIAVEGRIQPGEYEKDGVKHYTTDIIASRIEFLGTGGGGTKSDTPQSIQAEMEQAAEDMPF